MIQNKHGIPVQQPREKLKQRASSEVGKVYIERKIQRLYEFTKKGSEDTGYVRSTIFTPFYSDKEELERKGYREVRTNGI